MVCADQHSSHGAVVSCSPAGNDVEGLFRVPGTKSAIDRICEQIYMLDGVSSLDAPDATVFDVACVIKHLLRKLPVGTSAEHNNRR